ncbi:VTT domain-containing protein [Candidatus Woesearchaeota archaeon]|nr:VTT domain-containing protein [Candidatus Woesearchaeota archaeon]
MRKPDQMTRQNPDTGGWIHAALFIIAVATGLLIWLTPLRQWLSQGELLRAQLYQFGPAAPWLFGGASILLTAIGAPRLLLCSLAGLLFGAVEGVLWSQTTTLIGSYTVFVFARRFGHRYELKKFGKFSRFSGLIESNGVLSVLVIRQLPMSGFYNNLFLGLTRIRHREFLVGSFLGFLPLGVTASCIGAGLLQTDWSKSLEYAVAGLSIALILGVTLKWLRGMAAISQPPT